jgi:hypothetical protein
MPGENVVKSERHGSSLSLVTPLSMGKEAK